LYLIVFHFFSLDALIENISLQIYKKLAKYNLKGIG